MPLKNTKTTKKTKLKFTDFVILIDDREGLPYSFAGCDSKKRIVLTQRTRLKTGDYSLKEFENEIFIERKSLDDLFFTLGQERERFEQEFERLNQAEYAAIIVEASLDEILNPTATHFDWRSKLNPNSVFGTIISWSIRYPKVHWFFGGNRSNSERITFDLIRKYFEEKTKTK
jgi:ERCC4-type nuclease